MNDSQIDSKLTPLDSLDSAPDQVQLERFVTYRISTLANMLGRQMERFLNQQFGISLPDWRVLATLGRFKEMSVRELAAESKMDKALVSRVASRLAKQQLIDSQPHPEDGRLVVLTLTPAGRDMYHAIIPHAMKRHQKLLGSLAPEEIPALDQILNKLLGYAENLEQRSRSGNNESLIY
ncbi:MarR family winged helix-turn-helix transcriptional regulator [Marinobacterium rhizophilum]|uniref:MarR family transcriptional regulator n=1 Tax=Marinobacterium rhizophilum TaxID=420402 RepID=A0ABY5HJF6_9GAMM|nr:MarR family transcriptional regulator [Marinobacterium rhizophilum]UTW11402.1 MarR family transcriptional regulator [Marinobacterium rhizophilum]